MIRLVENLLVTPSRVIIVWLEGLWGIVGVIGIGLSALIGKGRLKDRLLARLSAVPTQRIILSILRAFAPNLSISRVVVKSYENTGTAVQDQW